MILSAFIRVICGCVLFASPRSTATRDPPMAKARAIVKRRKSVQNIRKITRTMELIATARFKKALDRATEAEAYTRKIAELVADLGATGADVSHPLLEERKTVRRALLLVITSNRGLAGGYNGNVIRAGTRALQDFETEGTPSRSKSRASAGSPSSSTGASPSTPPTTSSRTGRSSPRSRSWPTSTSACSSGARSTGSTWRTRGSSARPGRTRSSRPCCR